MDQSKLNYYDSNVESNGIVESPSNEVHLKGDRDNIVFMEKSQEYANISDNLEPRCSSNKELNDVNDVNEKNSDAGKLNFFSTVLWTLDAHCSIISRCQRNIRGRVL